MLPPQLDHHAVAVVSISGSCLDVLGTLYLAYDLLGGRHGPLRLLTRAVTYSIVFGIGYGLGLGLFFGLSAGIATGLTLAIEFNRAARGLDHYPLPWEALFSTVRGTSFAIGLYPLVGSRFAIAFGLLSTVGQVIAYSRGMRPAVDYTANRRPRITRRQFRGTLVRTVGNLMAALICSAFVHHLEHPWYFAVRVGLVTGLVTGIGITVFLTLSTTLTICRSDGWERSASASSFAASPCNRFSTGWPYSMYASLRCATADADWTSLKIGTPHGRERPPRLPSQCAFSAGPRLGSPFDPQHDAVLLPHRKTRERFLRQNLAPQGRGRLELRDEIACPPHGCFGAKVKL